MDNREEINEVIREGKYAFWKVFWTLLVVIVILSILGFALNSLGVFGSTVVERKVFENSYQRSESIKSQIATDEAVLSEIEHQLSNPGLDEGTRINLEAQARAARIRIRTAKSKE